MRSLLAEQVQRLGRLLGQADDAGRVPGCAARLDGRRVSDTVGLPDTARTAGILPGSAARLPAVMRPCKASPVNRTRTRLGLAAPVPLAAPALRVLAVRPAGGGRRAARCSWPLVPLRYLYALVRDFIRGDLGLRAMGLVYSSLFALVPVIAVSFSVLTAFGYHRELEPVLFEFLRPLGVKGYELTAEHHAVRRERADHGARHRRFRVPVLHRDHHDPEGGGRAQLHLARRAPAQPRQAHQRIPRDHAGGPGGRRGRARAADQDRGERGHGPPVRDSAAARSSAKAARTSRPT